MFLRKVADQVRSSLAVVVSLIALGLVAYSFSQPKVSVGRMEVCITDKFVAAVFQTEAYSGMFSEADLRKLLSESGMSPDETALYSRALTFVFSHKGKTSAGIQVLTDCLNK